MSRLTVWDDTTKEQLLSTTDGAAIAGALQEIGVRFERWPVAPLPPDAEADAVLAAYKPQLEAFMAGSPTGSVDVLRLTPDNPQKDALRAKFLSEHIHTEDEIRFFHDGSGNFILHVDGKVYDAFCEAGDLISVPANSQHWFDAGTAPRFTALRIFTDTSGWVPHYTGADIAERFPATAG
jgi:1,2-dihydroxy-3-keto-5-methylthiopentene dioxygenase